MANMGGSFFGVQDDNQFYCTPALASTDPNCAGTTVDHTVTAQNLADQLTAAGMTWKGYFQNLPSPTPPTGLVMTGVAANGPYTFKWPSSTRRLVRLQAQPVRELHRHPGCAGQHGARHPVRHRPGHRQAAELQPRRPRPMPRHARHRPLRGHQRAHRCGRHRTWVTPCGCDLRLEDVAAGRNAIVITWDEDDFSDSGQVGTGCCGADPGGGHMATIVITNGSNPPRTTPRTTTTRCSGPSKRRSACHA